jgi:hypothetical protein
MTVFWQLQCKVVALSLALCAVPPALAAPSTPRTDIPLLNGWQFIQDDILFAGVALDEGENLLEARGSHANRVPGRPWYRIFASSSVRRAVLADGS